MQKLYPFKFLDSYKREDKDFFFGRTDEIESLYSMIFKTRILLIYGTSGTGKTSLIQCGLANKFQTYDWLSLYIRRGSNLLASFDKVLCQESDDQYKYIEQQESRIPDLRAKIEAVHKASFKPIYLIFDQFEELFVLGSKVEQDQFIHTIKDILSYDQPVKIIISIREEYLGHLYDFEKAVPDLLNKKLRVEPMNLEKVKTVIKKIGQSPRSIVTLKEGEEDQIAAGIFEKLRGEEKTLTIQLPYLQVFLDSLYLKITQDHSRTTSAVFTLESLNKIGNIGDVLRNFLDEQVLMTAKNQNQKPELIWKILSPFVTLEGTKEPLTSKQLIDRFPGESQDLIYTILQAFVNSRILRYSEKEEFYEIAHDSLAKQVNAKRSIEEKAIMEVRQLIRSQVAVKKEARELFSEKQLIFLDPYLDKFKVNEDEKEWIEKSKLFIQTLKENEIKRQKDELAKAKKRQLILYSALGGTFIALIYAVFSAFSANNSAIAANDLLEKFKTESAERKKTRAEKDLNEFLSLESRANIVLDAKGCPKAITHLMDSLARINPDSLKLKSQIRIIDSIAEINNYCK